jgi:translation initiation factor 2 gamma subunit (eIF-2gamma)
MHDDLCIVTVSNRSAGPPTRGDRCSSTPSMVASLRREFAVLENGLAALRGILADGEELDACLTGDLVALVSKVDTALLRGQCREAHIVAARWAWWVLLQERGLSYSAIGRVVGRDHSSVIHGLTRAATCKRTQAVLAAVRSA